MNLTEIQNLIKFVAKSGVSEVEIEQEDFKITIKAKKEVKIQSEKGFETVVVPQVQQVAAPQPQAAHAPVSQVQDPAPNNEAESEDNSKYIEVKSPMIGTFYRSSSPDKPPFVSVGDSVKEGDVLCIVEAMKLFNEIESEFSGKIVKVLVDDAKPIEYDQPLFLIDPS
jgi:acetyl-CoA carboxylase biotin carboxyl carrier protein